MIRHVCRALALLLAFIAYALTHPLLTSGDLVSVLVLVLIAEAVRFVWNGIQE